MKDFNTMYWSLFIMFSLKVFLDDLKRNKLLIIILFSAYTLGIILGVILPKVGEKNYFLKTVVNLFSSALQKKGNTASIFLSRIFTDLFTLILFYILSISKFLIVANGFILFYRGYVLGAVSVALFSIFGVMGLALFISVVLTQNLISSAVLVVFSAFCFDAKNNRFCNKIKGDERLIYLVFAFVLILLSVLLQIIILFLFLRPINYFT